MREVRTQLEEIAHKIHKIDHQIISVAILSSQTKLTNQTKRSKQNPKQTN